MRRGLIWAPALGLALIVVGCNKPSGATALYSPKGDRFAYIQGDYLHVRSAGIDKVVAHGSLAVLAWSADGSKLAFTTEEADTTDRRGKVIARGAKDVWIYVLSNSFRIPIAGLQSPICWFNGDLLAVDGRSKQPQLATVDLGSGQIRYESQLPQDIVQLVPDDEARYVLIVASDQFYRFDGLNFERIGKPRADAGVHVVGHQSDIDLGFSTLFASHHKFYRWRGGRLELAFEVLVPARVTKPNEMPVLCEPIASTIEPQRALFEMVTCSGTPTQLAQISRDLQGFRKGYDKKADEALNKTWKKMGASEYLMFWSSAGGWKTLRSVHQKPGKGSPAIPESSMTVAMRPDGKEASFVGNSGPPEVIALP